MLVRDSTSVDTSNLRPQTYESINDPRAYGLSSAPLTMEVAAAEKNEKPAVTNSFGTTDLPFIQLPEYEYFREFYYGLDMSSTYNATPTDTCWMTNLVYFINDMSLVNTNASEATAGNFMDPVWNVTHALATNFSGAVVNCYYWGYSVYTVQTAKIALHANVGEAFIAFLFNFLGKAMTFRSIVNDIDEAWET